MDKLDFVAEDSVVERVRIRNEVGVRNWFDWKPHHFENWIQQRFSVATMERSLGKFTFDSTLASVGGIGTTALFRARMPRVDTTSKPIGNLEHGQTTPALPSLSLESPESMRPQLTASNNPAAAFEKELSEYWSKVGSLKAETASNRDAYSQIEELKKGMASRMVELWHGTEESADGVRRLEIKKITGEGGSGHTPHVVSTLRSFNGGLFWANVSSDRTIAGYPLIAGISRDVISKGEYGTQNGEITFPDRLNLDGQEITHLYAPSREVSSVQRALTNNQITGVKVLGFDELTKPEYKSTFDMSQLWRY